MPRVTEGYVEPVLTHSYGPLGLEVSFISHFGLKCKRISLWSWDLGNIHLRFNFGATSLLEENGRYIFLFALLQYPCPTEKESGAFNISKTRLPGFVDGFFEFRFGNMRRRFYHENLSILF